MRFERVGILNRPEPPVVAIIQNSWSELLSATSFSMCGPNHGFLRHHVLLFPREMGAVFVILHLGCEVGEGGDLIEGFGRGSSEKGRSTMAKKVRGLSMPEW